jgi:flavoprotein
MGSLERPTTGAVMMNGWQDRKAASVQAAPGLACPTCEAVCPAFEVRPDETTVYRCVGHGHRALTWRIDVNGEKLSMRKNEQLYAKNDATHLLA